MFKGMSNLKWIRWRSEILLYPGRGTWHYIHARYNEDMKKETAVSKGIRDRITITLHDNKEVNFDQYNSQCAPGIFNLDQKFHGVSCF